MPVALSRSTGISSALSPTPALKACRKEVASSSIKMECPKCRQTARITSRSTLLVCGRCGCPMDEAPPRAYYNHRYRRSILRDPDDEPSGC